MNAASSNNMTAPQPGAHPHASGLIAKIRVTLEMIKFEHSVFALPFALTGALLARHGLPSWREIFWIIVAMVGARSAAMTFNRIADLKIDALNPRPKCARFPRETSPGFPSDSRDFLRCWLLRRGN
jgi:heme O synthase-like polyprenyltransferase